MVPKFDGMSQHSLGCGARNSGALAVYVNTYEYMYEITHLTVIGVGKEIGGMGREATGRDGGATAQCRDIPISRYPDIPILGYPTFEISQHWDIPILGYPHIPILGYPNIPVLGYWDSYDFH